ncbi:MAG: hypothetical protein HYS81_04620 [Candidatus Aenigmatarchaeota archaeon]|nr:MAG: hypothetical protein HYS81_04620 [Candidatus Aenigmarchaeota archaeon]
MPAYYFDIETYTVGKLPNPDIDRIITIQFQKMDTRTGRPIGDLVVLKEWESSERDIVMRFYKQFFANLDVWDFIPVGFNLNFEWEFLIAKFGKYTRRKFTSKDFHWGTPKIDLRDIAILLNDGNFKGATLQRFSRKVHTGASIRQWYDNKEFGQIESYVKNENEAFLELYQKIKGNIQKLLE